MPLTHTKELFAKALKGKYALGAFNVNNMELLQAIVEACEEEKAPVMLQISKGARQYANPVYLKKLIEAAVSLSNIPIAVHLDHGDSFELCKECIDEGFTSVMIDASHEPFEKNVESAKRSWNTPTSTIAWSKANWACWSARSTTTAKKAAVTPRAAVYTHPDEAVQFVKAIRRGFAGRRHRQLPRRLQIQGRTAPRPRTPQGHQEGAHGCRAWAITRSCCTARPACPKDLVEEINKYGGKMGEDTAGVPEADIEIARRIGCTKVNIDTDLRLAMTAAIRKVLSRTPKEFDPRKYLGPARAKVKELVRHKVQNVLCCAGHAFD